MTEKTELRKILLANKLLDHASSLNVVAHNLSKEGWKISAQQIRNAINLLYDAERRLRNGDDVIGLKSNSTFPNVIGADQSSVSSVHVDTLLV